MKKKFLAVVLTAATVFAMVGCGADKNGSSSQNDKSDMEYVKEKGTLVVGVTNFEPMDYMDDNGKWIGFDAELAEAFGEKLCAMDRPMNDGAADYLVTGEVAAFGYRDYSSAAMKSGRRRCSMPSCEKSKLSMERTILRYWSGTDMSAPNSRSRVSLVGII